MLSLHYRKQRSLDENKNIMGITTIEYLNLVKMAKTVNELTDLLNETTSARITAAVYSKAKELNTPSARSLMSLINLRKTNS